MHIQERPRESGATRKGRRLSSISIWLSGIIVACVLVGIGNLLYVLMLPSYLDGFVYVDSLAEYLQIGILICLGLGFTLSSILLAVTVLLKWRLDKRAAINQHGSPSLGSSGGIEHGGRPWL